VASTRHIWFPELAKLLRENGFSAPRISISSKFLVKLYAFFDKQVKHLTPDLDVTRIYHSNNAKTILGWKPRSAEEGVLEAAAQIKKLL
jgi:dihydroflavonol-4-reductase